MGEFTKGVKKDWDLAGLANDLRGSEWGISEGPTPQGYTRIDRMINLGHYERVEGLAKQLLSQKEIKDAKKNDTLFEVLDDATREYMDELALQVGKQIKSDVYGTIDEGDAWLGQYEEGNLEELAAKFNIAHDDLKRHGLGNWHHEMEGSYLGESVQNLDTREGRAGLQEWLKGYLTDHGYSPGEAYTYVNSWVWDKLASWPPEMKAKILREINKAIRSHQHVSTQLRGSSMDGSGANDLAIQFVNGASRGHAGSMYIQGDRIYSYGPHFPIAERQGEAILVTSIPSPSQTTSTHINAVKRAAQQEGLKIVSHDLPPEV